MKSLGRRYDPRNFTCVSHGDSWWQYGMSNGEISGRFCKTSHESATVFPVLRPPWSRIRVEIRALTLRSTPSQCSYWLPKALLFCPTFCTWPSFVGLMSL